MVPSIWSQLLTGLVLLAMLTPFLGAQVTEEAKGLFRQAMELNDQRDYGTALEYFMRAYKSSPDILAQDDRGLLDNATEFLRAKAHQEPDRAETHFQLAELLLLRGLDDEGIQHYERVVALAGGTALAVLAQGELDRLAAARAAAAQATTATAANGDGSPSDGDSSSTDTREVAALKERVNRLQERLADLQRELEQQKAAVDAERDKTKAVQKELDELKTQSERWKLYYTLYMRELGRRNVPSN